MVLHMLAGYVPTWAALGNIVEHLRDLVPALVVLVLALAGLLTAVSRRLSRRRKQKKVKNIDGGASPR